MGSEDDTKDTNTSISAYREETWGKDVGGEYIIDGYKYIGFKRALEGLKAKMIKGAKGEINKVSYTVLDNRPSGTGVDIDIEVIENNSR